MRRLLTDSPSSFRRFILPVAGVALAAAIGNHLAVPMGSGAHILLGNVLVFAALRFLPPGGGLVLAPLATSPLWWFWHDPVLWLVWTIHIALIARVRTHSSIVITTAYCMTAGLAISLAGYVLLMGENTNVAWTAWASGAFNCVLNVTLGELLYLGIARCRPFKSLPRQRAGLEVILVTVMATTLLVPAWGFWLIQLPQLVHYGTDYARDRGRIAHQKAVWQTEWLVHTYADLLRTRALALTTGENGTLPFSANSLIKAVTIIDGSGTIRASTGTPDASGWPETAQAGVPIPEGEAHIRRIGDPQGGSTHLRMIAPILLRGEKLYAVADMDAALLNESLRLPVAYASRIAVERATSYTLGNRDQDVLEHIVANSDHRANRSGIRESLLQSPRPKDSPFSTIGQLTVVFSSEPPGLAGWTVITTERVPWDPAASEVLLMQLAIGRLLVIVVGITMAALLARYVSTVLRRQARAVANLAAFGETGEDIDNWLISELSDISASLAAHDARLVGEKNELVIRQKVLNTVLENINYVAYSAIHFPDGRFRMEFLTDHIEKLLGYKPAEALADGWAKENTHPDDWEERHSFELRNRTLKAPREYRMRHKDGHYVWIERKCVHQEFVPELGGYRVIGVYADITHRKQAQDEHFRADKLASLGRMAAGIAHELNQPLNFIRVSAINLREGLKRGLYPVERTEEKLTALLAQVERAGAIIKHMRKFGQPETVTREPVVLRAVVDQALALAGSQLALASISVDATRCGRHIIAVANPALLEQVVLNLLLNSRDAVLSRLEAEPQVPGKIKVRARREGPFAVLVIEDNGTGIPDDLMAMVFEPFFTTKAPDKGMGLGLSITFEIVKSLRGEIRAFNTGKGARFEIHLPAA